ncbi:hypothetical protein K7X08_011545 [Anisodus acutangulus]|uniref:Uncharacterized protein n=1 Tax=Anisodus acutangulus TaxID=402998 RepID=A0A9Q1MKX9_9SOLA|nr:hypothetical protein K7X08_011545 [Anisodus acutangulus]
MSLQGTSRSLDVQAGSALERMKREYSTNETGNDMHEVLRRAFNPFTPSRGAEQLARLLSSTRDMLINQTSQRLLSTATVNTGPAFYITDSVPILSQARHINSDLVSGNGTGLHQRQVRTELLTAEADARYLQTLRDIPRLSSYRKICFCR